MKPAEALPVLPAAARDLRRRDELAFLPAALEIVETPPSPMGRWLAFTLIAIFTAAVAWACIGKVDIIASAPGKIVPSGRVKVVQPFATGVVRAIHVEDGESVKQGQLLIELDPTISNADRDQQKSDLIAAELDVARLKAAVAGGDDPLSAFHPPAGADPAMVATARQYLLSEVAEENAKITALERERAEKAAERDAHAATIAKLKATIPLLEQRVAIRKYLMDKQYGSKITYLETLGELVDSQKQLGVEQSNMVAAEQAIAAADANRTQIEASYRSDRLNELATAEQKAASLADGLVKATELSKLQRLTAPVDGTVQQLAVHTIGGVVTPAQTLLEVVPRDSHLEIEAEVSNQDVGFVHAGETAEIKVDTFNFTKYGLLHGRVIGVSADAVPRDAAGTPPPNPAANGDVKAQDLVYTARVSLDRTMMDIDGRNVPLTPGMAVTVEIKTGSRRVISYLLSPLMRYGQDSLRER